MSAIRRLIVGLSLRRQQGKRPLPAARRRRMRSREFYWFAHARIAMLTARTARSSRKRQ
jgi:hypothetical protein